MGNKSRIGDMIRLDTIFKISDFDCGENLTLFRGEGVITIRRSELKRPEVTTEEISIIMDEARLMVKALNGLIEDYEQSSDSHDS